MKMLAVFVLALVASPCYSKSLPEEDSVVSVYTTQATTSGAGLDIYQQIANNLAEKISSPFYRLFRIEKNKTEDQLYTKKPWEKIELLDDLEPFPNKETNDIDDRNQRDIEELSDDFLKRTDKKPEKVTLYNSYLPVSSASGKLEKNNPLKAIDDGLDDELTLDDVDSKRKDGPFIFVLELLGSFFQLIRGAFESFFSRPSTSVGQPES